MEGVYMKEKQENVEKLMENVYICTLLMALPYSLL